MRWRWLNALLWGGLAGLLVTTPLAALFYAGHAVAGLSFVPFTIFDWTTRILPGPVLTFGIDAIVGIVRGLGMGNTSATAKTAEQVMAVVGFVTGGIIFGAVLFAILRGSPRKLAIPLGILAGGLAGLIVFGIGRSVASPAG